MDIYIKWDNDKSGIKLPINPESFMVSNSNNNTSVTVHNLGEISLKGKRNLWEITMSSFFPASEMSFAHDSFRGDPYDYYVDKLQTVFEANTTVHLIITETSINMFATIESFEYGHEDRTGDVSYTLAFKEHREYESKGGRKTKRTTKAVKKTTHKWKKGDTWQKVTKSTLGSSSKWKQVKRDNAATVKKAKKKHPGKKEKDALVGYKVVINP